MVSAPSKESKMPVTAHRAETQKAYKKAKKKRRKIRKAEKRELEEGHKEENPPSSSEKQTTKVAAAAPKSTKWRRIGKSDGCKKAVDRPVNEDKINDMLEKRSKAKAKKDYTESDEITKKLVEMEIVYDDAMKQWHTRLLSTVAKKARMEQARQRENE